ncbi:hypothetical protein OHS33_39175 (plasmid) [Streptomyces sp. NBC_00536]|uniref:hypothetical protein n=1 Tax=Streptomyces sp. NBC_00536 TaxID=2975769 RepID=UPI002E804D78|nr:hypothetical protein [Streptomyces sp. NBC_00536]WUC84382.1 hypothetical protein OHS33_39175 [Streptomyces sp. NBC_00536]
MSAMLAKATDHQLYVTITQRPDGRVSDVELSDEAPDRFDVWTNQPASTVWATPAPAHWDGDNATAAKVLDLAVSSDYRFGDGHGWSEGERDEFEFRTDKSEERAFLRAVEAHLIRAGHLDVHTGVVGCREYGLLLRGIGEDCAFLRPDGWAYGFADCFEPDGRFVYPDPIAPCDSSPRYVAAAILAVLVDRGPFDLKTAPMLQRAHIRYALWRQTPNWANFKYRTRQRAHSLRYRLTHRAR